MKYKNLTNLIDNSYLSEEKKADLITLLEEDKVEKFFDLFYEYLEFDLTKSLEMASVLIDTYDKTSGLLEKELESKKEELYSKLESDLGLSDESSKGLVWDEYYSKVEEVNNEYRGKLKEALPKITREYIRR